MLKSKKQCSIDKRLVRKRDHILTLKDQCAALKKKIEETDIELNRAKEQFEIETLKIKSLNEISTTQMLFQ